jgi:hypothetical protein
MYANPVRHERSRNCHLPLAEDDGLRAPTPEDRSSSVPPLSRSSTQAAQGRRLRGNVAAERTAEA